MRRSHLYHRTALVFILCLAAKAFCFCQHRGNSHIWDKLISVEDSSLSTQQKLQQVLLLKKECEDQKLPEDSVYARIIHRTALYEYLLNNKIPTRNTVLFTLKAVRINSSGRIGSSPPFCINSYTNLGNYYKSLQMYGVAARYYDSAFLYRKRYVIPEVSETILLTAKAEMLSLTGDYQNATEELSLALVQARAAKDEYMLQVLFNQRAQAHLMQGQLEQALNDVNQAVRFSASVANDPESINSLMIKARIFAANKDFTNAVPLFKKAIRQRARTADDLQIADDYTDLGNVYLDQLHDYKNAKDCYLSTIQYASKAQDRERLAKGHINLQYSSFKQQHYKESEQFCIQALTDLGLSYAGTIFLNPAAQQLSAVGNKELVLVILGNKLELLVSQFTQTGDKNYLAASLQTALLADTVITTMRHEQTGEQSKLYWREWTRELYGHALEACYLSRDAALAFFFMEKSRAVLLNDKLNELGATAYLPQAEAAREREYQEAVIREQQKLDLLNSQGDEYTIQQARLSETRRALEHYIKSLEEKYPVYYQYKYADEVPQLNILENELRKRGQSFVHYFISDSAGYAMSITPSGAKLVKLSKEKFSTDLFAKFLRFCADEISLNNQYPYFASLAHSLFALLFQPLNVPAGRVVICPDNFFIPFEALAKDKKGTGFLINDYMFSYVYSARYFLREHPASQAAGSFIGFAPVSFKAYPNIPDLKPSGVALQQSARHYQEPVLLVNNQATRRQFFHTASRYTVINIFSHAQADTAANEAVLYLYDSLIHLSELPLLRKPATQLIVLSACQTNIGKTAPGEGIFSLARGFASAGIPSVAATLWKADEQTIYTISEKFHEYLSKGMLKDEALQKAKLYFINNGSSEKPLPYYWANIIVIGNAEHIELMKSHFAWWWIAALVVLSTTLGIVVRYRKKYYA